MFFDSHLTGLGDHAAEELPGRFFHDFDDQCLVSHLYDSHVFLEFNGMDKGALDRQAVSRELFV